MKAFSTCAATVIALLAFAPGLAPRTYAQTGSITSA